MFNRSCRGTRRKPHLSGGARLFESPVIRHLTTIEIPHDTTQAWILSIPYRSRSKTLNIDSRSADASREKDPGAIAEEGGSTIPKGARPVRVPAHLQRLKLWRKVDPVEGRRTATTKRLSGAIHPHLRHRSHPVITRNATVRGRCPSDCPLLTVSSTNTVTSAILDPGQEVLHPDKGEQNVADEKKSDWKSTASATAKLFLRGVRDTADAFGPLKSVAGGLCFILDNCEV